MATHDYVLDNATGANFRSDLNNALAAIVSNNSSSSEPSTKYAYQWWADTNDGVLKIRNSSNDGWVTLLQLDGTLTLEDGSASAPALGFRDDLNTGIFSSAADTVDVSCGGTTRGSFSSSGLTVTGNVTATTFVGNVDAVDGDFDGTLEADAITVAGVALSTVIAGTTVTTATNANHISVADNESTNENNLIPFIEDASATGNVGLESDGDFTYNPSTGTVTATLFAGTLSTAAQTNITSLGTLTGLTVQGDVTFDGATAGRDIVFDRSENHMIFKDNAKLIFGTGSDLEIFHADGNTFITESGSINLKIQASDLILADVDGTEYFHGQNNAGVDLKHNGNTKLQTVSGGVTITGTCTATAFSGDGSALTGISTSGTTINNNADNRIITGSDTADTLNGESNVVIDSSGRLGIGTTSPSRNMELVNSSGSVQFSIVSANNQNAFLNLGDTDDDNIGGINYDNTNNRLRFRANAADRAQLKSNGDFAIDDGNLVIGTSGHGIDFSVTGGPDAGSGSSTSELLDDYERGGFNAEVVQGLGTLNQTFDDSATYEKIGNLVHIQALIQFQGTGNGTAVFLRLPFTHVTDTSLGGGVISFTNVAGLSGESTLTLVGQSGQSYCRIKNKSSDPSISGFQNNNAIYYHFTYHTS